MRVAVIGRGRWGANIVRTLATLSDVDLVAESKDIDAILQQRPAGVLIATPSATHADIAIPFIDAGVPTFIEKPMATTVSDAMRIQSVALRTGTPVVVGHVHRFNPALRAARRLLPQLGTVQAVFWEGMNQHPRTDSSVLWDWLPHGLSAAQDLLDANPRSVQTWCGGEVSQCKTATAKFEIDDVPFIASVSWLSLHKRHGMTIVGSDNSLIFDDTAQKKLALCSPEGTSFPAYDAELPLTSELQAFIALLRNGNADTSSLEWDVAIVRAIAAAEESARNDGRLVAI